MPLDFKAKLGPLPVWAWGAIGGGVIIVGYYLMNRGGSSAESTGSSTLDPSGYQTSGISGGSADTSDPAAVYDTNSLWLTRAARQTAELASASTTDVYNALKKWLAGDALSTKEKGWVDIATKNTGLPPEGTEGVSPVTPDTPTPVTSPKRYPTNKNQYYVTTSSQAAKYLFDVTKGKIVGGAVDPVTWAGLRLAYGNNIDVRIVPASSIAKWRK